MTVHDELILKIIEKDENGVMPLHKITNTPENEDISFRLEHTFTLPWGGSLVLATPDIVVFFKQRESDSKNPYANPPIHGYAIEIENDIQWDFSDSLRQIKKYFQGYYPIVIIPKIYERYKEPYEHEKIDVWLWSAKRIWECMDCGDILQSDKTGKPKKCLGCNSNQLRLKGISDFLLEK